MEQFPSPSSTGMFVVLVGPSGVGKSTVMSRYVAATPGVVRCLSVTTRAPRGSELHGVDYWFINEEEFVERVASGSFLEHARVFGKAGYGTPRDEVERLVAAGRVVIKDVDVQGARQIKAALPSAVLVFVAPPDHHQLELRLRGRGTESEAAITRRLAEAERELACWTEADYLVVNETIDRAVADLAAIIRAEQLRIAPRQG